MSTAPPRAWTLALALLLLDAASAAQAQPPPQEASGTGGDAASPASAELAQLRAEVAHLRAQLESTLAAIASLRGDLERLRGSADRAATAALEAQAGRLQEDVKRIEEQLRQTADALDALSRELISRVSLSVYGSFEARRYSGDNGFLDGNLVELVFSGRPHKRLSMVTQIEFERAGGGAERAGEIAVEQAWAGLQLTPNLTFRAGIYLVPFGNVQLDHFPFKREVVTRPLINQVVAPGDWSDNGVGFSGSHLVASAWLLSYEVYAGAGLGSALNAAGLSEARQAFGVDNNRNTAFMGRMALGRGSRSEIGLSGYTATYDDAGRQRLNAWALDVLGTLGRLRLNGEYNSFRGKRTPEPDARYRGLYARAVYDFGRGWVRRGVLGRDFDDPRVALVAQYDRVTNEGPLADGFARTREARVTLGLNYRPASQWVLKASYERNSTTNLTLVRGDRDGWIGSINFVF